MAADSKQSLDEKFGFQFLRSARSFFNFLRDLSSDLSFLRTSDRRPYLDPIFWNLRLFLFLQLIQEEAASEKCSEPELELMPPPDVACVWASLLIRRVQYRSELPPDKVDTYSLISWRPPMPIRLPADLEEAARLQAQDERSRKAWSKAFPNYPYDPTDTLQMSLNLNNELQRLNNEGCTFVLSWRQISSDVNWIVLLSERFPECIETTEEFLSKSYQSYYDWMSEFRKTQAVRGTEGPTMEIDLFWHVHQMNPLKYIEFCERDGGHANWHCPKSDLTPPICPAASKNYRSAQMTCCCSG